VSRLRFKISMSLEGFVTGHDLRVDGGLTATAILLGRKA
jgi:hypothetical protein